MKNPNTTESEINIFLTKNPKKSKSKLVKYHKVILKFLKKGVSTPLINKF